MPPRRGPLRPAASISAGSISPTRCARSCGTSAVKEATGGGADYAFECVGKVEAMELAYAVTRRGGIV